MSMTPSQDDLDERKEIWRWIRWWKEKFGLTSAELADKTPYSQDLIEKGTKGEPIPVKVEFMRACVLAFGLVEITGARTADYGKAVAILSFDKCKKLLKPPRELTPSEKLPYLYGF